MKITFQQAREFLENISKEDKVAILTHDDSDGIMSGILYNDFIKPKNKPEIFIFSYNKTKKTYNFSKFNKILIADLAPALLQEIFSQIKDKEVLYIDHHPEDAPVPEKILEIKDVNDKSPCAKIIFEICGGKEWLSVAGAISDSADKYEQNMSFINNFLKKEKISLEDYKQKYAYRFGKFLVYFDNTPEKSFKLLSELNNYKDIGKLEKYIKPIEDEETKTLKNFEKNQEKLGAITFFIFEPKYEIKSIIINKISYANKKEIFMFLVPFENHYRISYRIQSGLYDGVKILKDCEAENFGGHPAAGGGKIKKSFLAQFKKNLKNYNIENAKINNGK
jgi:single-stranded DNA-specific DHH superfamily exonuclease